MATSKHTLCGIYKIENLANGKVYIGSSARIGARWVMHRSQLRNKKHHSITLQRAWDKYGEAMFVFEIIEHVPEVADLFESESRHIRLNRSAEPNFGYNLCPVAGSTLGIKLGPHSADHRSKISAAQKGKIISEESRNKLSATLKGRTIGPVWRENMRKAMLGKKMAPLSAEHKEMISAVHKGKKLSPEQHAKLLAANLGRRHTPEDKKKKSQAGKSYWATQTPEQRLARIRKTVDARAKNRAKDQLPLF
jgi:group I intron endonuclease